MPQEHTRVRLESAAFSCDNVFISELRGKETIGQLYRFDLVIVAISPGEIDPAEVLGSDVTMVFELGDEELRRISGVVVTIQDLLDSEPETRTFRIVVLPRAHRLTLVETQQIFMGKSTPEIIQEKVSLVGLADALEMRLLGSYPKRELVTEYKESDLAFVSRLAEHLGISFFFEEGPGGEKIVFTDSMAGFHSTAGAEKVHFRSRGDKRDVYRFETSTTMMPKQWVVQDYNYRTPQVDLTASHEAPRGFSGGVVEYAPNHKTPEAGKHIAQIRAEEREASTDFFVGETDLCQLAAGSITKLEGHPRLDGGKHLLLVEVEHHVKQVVANHGGGEVERYRNTFRAVDANRSYRPPRVTPVPKIDGVVTALVEPQADGSIGKIAELDDQGRYTVWFYFDTAPAGERGRSTHRVRLLQHHAGPNYGTHLPLKAGIEVLVAFVDGDIDRPLIIGTGPNPITRSPVDSSDPLMHRTRTATGILIQMRDDY